jgi:hypothetical protein
MSDSRKDGRHRGGHIDIRCTEVWSRRCPKVNMWRTERQRDTGKGYKEITHRYERRQGVQSIRHAMVEMTQFVEYHEPIWEPTELVELPDGTWDVV